MTVYVVQEPMTRDRHSGDLVSKFDFSSAGQFGEVQFLLSPDAKPWDSTVAKELEDKLQDFRDGDWLILTGSPALMGLAATIATLVSGGSLRVLQWSRDSGFRPVTMEIDLDEYLEDV